MRKSKPHITVLVEQAPRRKGWLWRQIGRTGGESGRCPEPYDTKALAKRAGQAQVDRLNKAVAVRLPADIDQRLTPEELKVFEREYAVLKVAD